MSQQLLTKYRISKYGFLPETPPLTKLPAGNEAWEDLAATLPEKNQTKTTRDAVRQLPEFKLSCLVTPEDFHLAYLILTYITQSYVFMGQLENPMEALPHNLAYPLCEISQAVGLPPIGTYSAYCLWNWKFKDPEKGMELDNLDVIYKISHYQPDESWFFLVSTIIEAQAAPMLEALCLYWKQKINLEVLLERMRSCLKEMLNSLNRMREKCKPKTFFNDFRPYVNGWKGNDYLPNGMYYTGVYPETKKYVGGSGAQSTVFKVLDALLGIEHSDDYFKMIEEYMPPPHRMFLEEAQRHPLPPHPILEECKEMLLKFRKVHKVLVSDYIVKLIPKDDATGTGGTPIEVFLKETIRKTKQALVFNWSRLRFKSLVRMLFKRSFWWNLWRN